MKKILLAGITVFWCLAMSTPVDAENVALGKPVNLEGTFFTGGGWWTDAYGAGVNLATVVDDGVFMPDQNEWQLGSVWWNGYDHPENSIIIDLQGPQTITSFVVQADDNDTYKLEYRNGASGTWTGVWDIPTWGSWGVSTRPTEILGTPITATELRFTATGGDGWYSVSEVQAFGKPGVPDAGCTWLLLGVSSVGLALLRRSRVIPA